MMLVLILLPVAFLLPPGAGAGEIIGGREAKPHSRRCMAYLDIEEEGKFSRCGGFLVSENFVLTAAHCNGDKITVLLGAHDKSDKQEEGRQVIRVRRQIPHTEYNKNTQNNDIMLLQLDSDATLNEYVKPIHLPRANEKVKPGTKCSVAGWGMTGFAPRTDTLWAVDVKVLKDKVCLKNPYRPYSYRHYNASTMLCAGDPKKVKDAAKGDSGGPLVCKGTAQGIVSWGYNCPPGVYTRISTFIPWIQKEMKKPHP